MRGGRENGIFVFEKNWQFEWACLFAAAAKSMSPEAKQADSPANLQPNTAPRAAKKRRTPEGVRHFNIHDASFQ